ncbi:hypothetical protein PG987_003520 [Apiospora arundinis]
MDHTSRTGCYYTTVGNYHDLSSRPHIAIEPIKGCHPKGIVPDSIAVERVVLERAVQAEIDEINESRRKNDWLGSHYVWNSREKAWTRRPLYNGPTPMPRKIFKDKGAHLQKVKSDNPLNKREAMRPHPVRRVRTHEHPLHHRREHRDGHGLHHSTDAQAKHTRGHPTQAHGHRALHNHHRANQDKCGMEGQQHQHPHHHRDDKQGVAQEEWLPIQALNEDHPLDVFSEMFSDDENNPAPRMSHRKSPQRKPVESRRPAHRPVLARIHSSKGKLVRHHAPPPHPHPQRPALHRTETYLENLPKRDAKQKTHHHPKQVIEKHARGLPLPPHPHRQGVRGMGGNHPTTTHHQKRRAGKAGDGKQSDSHVSIQGDQEASHPEPTPNAHPHVEDMQLLNPGGHPSTRGDAKTRVRRRTTFIIGPEHHSTPSDSSTPHSASVARKIVEDEANHTKPQQQSIAGHSQEAEEHLDLKERLRREIMAEDNKNAVHSSFDDDDNEATPRPQPPAQQRHFVSCPSIQSRVDQLQQPSAAGQGEEGEEDEPVDLKERLRRAIMAEDNEKAVCSASDHDGDDEEGMSGDGDIPRAQSASPTLPPGRQQTVPSPSDRSIVSSPHQPSAASQEGGSTDVEEMLRHAIMTEDNQVAVCSDEDGESEVDNEETPKALPPLALRQHQKAVADLSSQSKARKQEAVRERLLRIIATKGHKIDDTIQEEEEEEAPAPSSMDTRQSTPPSYASTGSKPSSLLTEGFMAQRVAAAAAVDDVGNNAPHYLPVQQQQDHQQQQEQEQQDDPHHPFGPEEPLMVTIELRKREVERWGTQVITRAVYKDDVPEHLRAQNKANLESQLVMRKLVENGHRTALKIQRIREEDVKNKPTTKEGRKKQGRAGRMEKKERPDYVLDYRYDHVSEQPMPNCGSRYIW